MLCAIQVRTWPFLFSVPQAQSPLLQDEIQYLKLIEPKEADHWFSLSPETIAPPRWLALTGCLYFCKGYSLTRQPDDYNGPSCLRAVQSWGCTPEESRVGAGVAVMEHG